MLRSTLALVTLAMVATTAGCRMCAHPYDYCGPTFTGEDCQQCMPNARACSILSPGGSPCCSTQAAPETVPMSEEPVLEEPVTEQYGDVVLAAPSAETVVGYAEAMPEIVPATEKHGQIIPEADSAETAVGYTGDGPVGDAVATAAEETTATAAAP